jgi:hypothetical protein
MATTDLDLQTLQDRVAVLESIVARIPRHLLLDDDGLAAQARQDAADGDGAEGSGSYDDLGPADE